MCLGMRSDSLEQQPGTACKCSSRVRGDYPRDFVNTFDVVLSGQMLVVEGRLI